MISGLHQRSTYKLIDKLLSAQFKTPFDLLSSLVRDIVESSELVMTGGRVWELEPDADAYALRYQIGEIEFLSEGTRRTVEEMPAMASLVSKKSIIAEAPEEDERGKRVYSLTGVGDVVKRPSGKLYTYALAFTAHDLNEEFYDTMIVIGSAASTALRNMSAAAHERKLRKDLDQAWEIQRGLVPDHETTFRDYDIYGVSLPDSVVGGDYFDYLRASEEETDRLGLVISDAASKGLPAAVQALFVSGALRMGIGYNTKMSALIGRLNTLIYDTFPYERFVSLCYCELTHSENGLVLYLNAGHCPPIHFQAATNTTELLQPTGGILGIVEDQPFRVENINMKPGDVLLMYTDGITEGQNAHNEQFGEARLIEFVKEAGRKPADEIAKLLLERVQTFTIGSAYTDDKTLIVIKRRG
ncbi:MAG: serine/threonine-protein phosphatase [Bacteroidetes bacterium]|nr:serine/threonine-protein phosphatase [Bacteroidota bacterium]